MGGNKWRSTSGGHAVRVRVNDNVIITKGGTGERMRGRQTDRWTEGERGRNE